MEIGYSQRFSKPYADNSNNAWNVNFNNGNVNWNNVNNNNYVRPVRQHSTSISPSVLMTYTTENLWRAYHDCLSKKKSTISAIKFEIDREKNLFALLDELQNRTYAISQHICFIIKEPTPREIFAADFRDRIVHHLLCNEIAPLIETEFIDTSFANRKGKGTHKAVECLRIEMKKEGYFLKLDIQAFFRSIDKDILFRILENKIRSLGKDKTWIDDILWLCKTIIYHDPINNYIFRGQYPRNVIHPSKSLFFSEGKGLPIGNLTSQFFGNLYLNEMDQYIQSLGFKHVRYVDDFIVFSENKQSLIDLLPKIDLFVKEHLHLSIHPKKIILQHVSKGADFLGYFVRPSYTLVRKKVLSRFKKKMWEGNYEIATLNSYLGHFIHANSYHLRKSICEKVSAITSLSFDERYTKFNPLP